MSKNYYELLGVSEDASIDEIRAAYRAAMLRNHPDLHVGGSADQNSRNLNLAYETLTSAVKRAQYDDRLRRHRARQSERRDAESSNPNSQSSTPPDDTAFVNLFQRYRLIFISSAVGIFLFCAWILFLLADPFSFFVAEAVSQPSVKSTSEFNSDDNRENTEAEEQTAEAPVQTNNTEITPAVPSHGLAVPPTLTEESSEDSNLPLDEQGTERRPSESTGTIENQDDTNSTKSVTDGIETTPGSFSKKQPIPNNVDIAAAEEKIRLVFGDRYDSGNTREQKIDLAQELLEVGIETNDDIAARYVLYQSASRIAVSTATAPLYRRIVGTLANDFDIGELDLLMTGYAAMIESPDAASKTSELLSVITRDIFRYRALGQLSNAKSLCDIGLNVARDTPAEQDLVALSDFIVWQMGKKSESASALATVASLSNIRSAPETARADLFVAGWYRCFSQGNWRVGLPLLANGADQILSNLAQLEITEGRSAASRIGNAWWDYSNTDGLSVYERAHIQHHASEWLKLAVDGLAGLDKMLAEKRLRDSMANVDEISSYVKLAIEFDEVQGSTPIEVAHAWQQKTGGLPADDAFSLVAISGNGKIAAFLSGVLNSADGSNFIRLYSWDPKLQVWQQFGNDIFQEAAQDRHGCSVALSDNGNTIAIGADMGAGNGIFGRAGQVSVYRWSASHALWKQLGKSIKGKATADCFGRTVSLSADGNTLAVGASNGDASVTHRDGGQGNGDNEGQVSIFVWEDSVVSWKQLGNIIDGEAKKDNSGSALALSADGTTIAIGAHANSDAGQRSGHVRVYRWFKSIHSWKQLGNDIDGEVAGDNSGSSVALSANGEVIAIGAPFAGGNGLASGQIRVFKWQNRAKSWRQLGNDIQGQSAEAYLGNRDRLALTHNGQKLVFADKHGFVKLFEIEQDDETWKQSSFFSIPENERVARIVMDSSGETIGFWMYGGPSMIYQWAQSEFVDPHEQRYDGSPDVSEHQASEHSRPRLAIAPFEAPQAKAYQDAWAKFLGVEVETENSIGMKFRLIPAGRFLMGSNSGDDDEKPTHPVQLLQPFEISKHEVTQLQYERVQRRNPSSTKNPISPINNVSWYEATEFCKKLSALPNEHGYSYRLPTEAEWEYACRAGTRTEFSGNAYLIAWFDKNSSNVQPVGTKLPNAWGLHDMHGNVSEWCSDPYLNYDGTPSDAGENWRIRRGGSWFGDILQMRSATRGVSIPHKRSEYTGFRVVRVRSDEIKSGIEELER